MKLATSPDRLIYQRDAFLKRQADKGLTPENDKSTQEIFELYEKMRVDHMNKYNSTPPQNDLEYDLRASELFVSKVRDENYAQRLYATLCNNDFYKGDNEEPWHCSWRSAGGIVADLRQEGEYIDWYLSGMRYDDGESAEIIPEGTVCPEVEADLETLGWRVEPYAGLIDTQAIGTILKDAEEE
jgi:hypothetical protein